MQHTIDKLLKLADEYATVASHNQSAVTKVREAIRTALTEALQAENERIQTELQHSITRRQEQMASADFAVASLKAERDEYQQAADKMAMEHKIERDTLRQQLTEAQRDADTYRWLRDNSAAISWNPSRYNAEIVSGFAHAGTGYLGFSFEDAIKEALKMLRMTDEQEPVAWIERDMNCDDYDPDSICAGPKPDSASDGWEWVPLFLPPAPAQSAKPLTDDLINALMPTNTSMSRNDALIWMAKAIERAHNIGVSK